MKSILLAASIILFSFCTALAGDPPTKDDAKAMVKIAVAYAKENGKQKIKNALEVWKDDLGEDYHLLSREMELP